jgi:hypothetical protein
MAVAFGRKDPAELSVEFGASQQGLSASTASPPVDRTDGVPLFVEELTK